MTSPGVRLVEIAELLGVTEQLPTRSPRRRASPLRLLRFGCWRRRRNSP